MNHIKDISEGKYNYNEWLMSMRITDAQWREIYQSSPIFRSHIPNATSQARDSVQACAEPLGSVNQEARQLVGCEK